MSFTTIARLAGVAACSLAALHAVPAVAATAHTAARADTGALTSKALAARTVLTSTSGKKLTMTVSGTSSSSGSTVTIGLSSGNESHMWSFKARSTDVKIGSTGAGTITLTSAQTGDRGKLNLKFSPTTAVKKRMCGDKVAAKSRQVSVSGIAFFKTGTRPWGNVGKSAKAISFNRANTVTWAYDVTCATAPTACTSSLSWSSWKFGGSVMEGVSGSRRGDAASVSGFRSTNLSKPAGASRLDSVTVPKAPLPTFAGDTSSATLTAKVGTGSLTIAAQNGYDATVPCGSGGSASTTQWMGAATNGSPAFKIPAQVFGAFTVPNGQQAAFTRQVS
jgi:hypothetical protein